MLAGQQLVVLSLKQFLVTEQHCPAEWAKLDLYLIRDDRCAFYVGQSECAFMRVWEHIRGGFKGQSAVGRFILSNWPASMKFSVELLSSHSEAFASVGNDLDTAERMLIEHWTPCFNIALNDQPSDLPEQYFPTTFKPRCSRSLKKLIMEANIALQTEQRRKWLTDST